MIKKTVAHLDKQKSTFFRTVNFRKETLSIILIIKFKKPISRAWTSKKMEQLHTQKTTNTLYSNTMEKHKTISFSIYQYV